jgi:hypothetical protein
VPARLIHISLRLPTHIHLGFLHRLDQSGTHSLFLSRDTAQAEVGVEGDRHQFLHIPITHPKPPAQITNHGLSAWPKTARRHLRWPLTAGLRPTHRTGQRVLLIFRDFWLHPWQFTDSMAAGTWVLAQQQCPAVLTTAGFANYHAMYLLRRFELTPFTRMTFLPTALAPLFSRFGYLRA